MRFSTLSFAVLLGNSLCTALPTAHSQFYLVTSDDSNPSTNSSQLHAVSATTPFDESPSTHTALLLRLLEPGYNTLPTFALSNSTGVLSTTITSQGALSRWYSTAVQENAELQFVASEQKGNIALGGDGEYLLTVGGASDGWTICHSETGQSVLWWKGTAEGCKATYLHAVKDAPYRRRV